MSHQQTSYPLRALKKVLRFLLLTLVGLSLSWGIPHGLSIAQANSPIAQAQPQLSLQDLMKRADDHYQAERFAPAEADWQQVVERLGTSPETTLQQVRALSNLSLAQQALAKWTDAETNINAALSQLDIPPGTTQLQTTEQDETTLLVLAQSGDIRGQLYYLTGRFTQALTDWQQTQQLYQRLRHRDGQLGSLLNQAQAYQAQGQYLRAEANLTAVEQMMTGTNREFRVFALHNLAKTERLLGKLTEAVEHLKAAIALLGTASTSSTDRLLQAQLQLETGNLQQALAVRARDRRKTDDAIDRLVATLQAYERTASLAQNTPQNRYDAKAQIIQLQASLNLLHLRITFAQQFHEAARLGNDNDHQVQALVHTIGAQLADLESVPIRKVIYGRIHFANLLMTLAKAHLEANGGELSAIAAQFEPENLHQQSLTQLAVSTEAARELHDIRVEAEATGQIGILYFQDGELDPTSQPAQWQHAQKLLQDAIVLSSSANAPDIRYRWHHQLGQLFEKQKKSDNALNAYRSAVEDLRRTRSSLLAIDSEVQFSFRDNIEPIYRDFIDLLLTTANKEKGDSQKLIEETLRNFDELQLTEINNFLGCDSGQEVALREVDDSSAGIIYMITSKEYIGVILDLPNSHGKQSQNNRQYKLYFDQRIPSRKVVGEEQFEISIEEEVEKIREVLESSGKRPKILKESRILYNWLLMPIMEDIQKNPNLKTLVFVPDADLRNLPMHVLYDGSKYLIQNYSVVYSPRIQLFNPQPVDSNPDIFLGGFGGAQTIKNRPFKQIERLQEELDRIFDLGFSDSPPLTDQSFISENIAREIRGSSFSVVHFKAHGVFASDPEETFIAANREPILGRKLGSLVQAGTVSEVKEIDILGLSACTSAQGDDRAVLGLTGIAVRAGARSVISSLWVAQDDVNTEVMPRFYEAIYKEHYPRAEAFKKVVVELIEDSSPDQPYEWATYMLVGNWL
jgi:CHAT domain-containing protein